MNHLLNDLINDARVWQASQHRQATQDSMGTGFTELDAHLAGRGWPQGALIECLPEHPGIGELQLFLPVLKRLTGNGKAVFWIDSPQKPYAPALARAGVRVSQIISVQTQSREDHLWSLENCLRSPATGMVMAWPGTIKRSDIRRLQLAAEAEDSLCILFREPQHAGNSSPAALRLKLNAAGSNCLQTDILKRRGGWPVQGLKLALSPVVDTPAMALNSNNNRVIQGPWLKTTPASSPESRQ
jgi:hypothetical protein